MTPAERREKFLEICKKYDINKVYADLGDAFSHDHAGEGCIIIYTRDGGEPGKEPPIPYELCALFAEDVATWEEEKIIAANIDCYRSETDDEAISDGLRLKQRKNKNEFRLLYSKETGING